MCVSTWYRLETQVKSLQDQLSSAPKQQQVERSEIHVHVHVVLMTSLGDICAVDQVSMQTPLLQLLINHTSKRLNAKQHACMRKSLEKNVAASCWIHGYVHCMVEVERRENVRVE